MACSSSTPAAWWFTIAVLFFVVAAASAGWISDDPNPIRMVPDELREVEAEVVRVVGRTRHALSFARFAVRHGKRYESPEELKMRFEVFSENKRLIRSTNRKRLSYTLAVNRKLLSASSFFCWCVSFCRWIVVSCVFSLMGESYHTILLLFESRATM